MTTPVFFVLATVVLKRFHACVTIQTCAKAKYGIWYASNGRDAVKTMNEIPLPCVRNCVSDAIITFYSSFIYSRMRGIASGPLLQERRKPVYIIFMFKTRAVCIHTYVWSTRWADMKASLYTYLWRYMDLFQPKSIKRQ